MASTYSELKIELVGTGEQAGTWGDTTNTNLGTALGEAITGSADVTFASADVNLTLTDTNTAQTARNLRLNLVGTAGGSSRYLYLSSGCNIEKFYLVNNGLDNAVIVQNKIGGTASGSTVVVPAGKSMFIYNTGTNVVDAATHFTAVSLTTPLAVTSGGTGGTTSTGSGAVVLATSPTLATPTLTAPVLGTPTSGNFSTGTFTWPTFNQSTTGNALTATSAVTATNLAGGLAFRIPYQTGAGVTAFTGTPTDNTYLKYNTSGGFTWATIGGGTAFSLTMNNGGAGDVSGSTFDGNAARTISYNTIGASPLAGSTSLTTTGTVTTGTWSGSFGAVSGANLTNLNASNLASGTVAVARLGTGTPSSSTYLRGDGTWATVSAATANALTMNNSGTGAASGTTFDGSVARVISHNTIGASPLAGSTSITTLGTITTGTWNGTTIATARGGTGLTSFTSGGAVYATSTSALTTGTLPVASGGTGTASSINYGFKNRLINGNISVVQRLPFGSTDISTSEANPWLADRWQLQTSSLTGKFSGGRNFVTSTVPAGFNYNMGVQASANYTPAAGESFDITQVIEGFNIQDLDWGLSSAQAVTLSFYVRASVAGTYAGAIRNDTKDMSYVFTYTVSAGNTWEPKTVTIPGPTSGAWQQGLNGGMIVSFSLGSYSTFQTASPNTWLSTGNYVTTTTATKIVTTLGRTISFTGIQLERGSTATDFDARSIGTEITLCQRYFQAMGAFAAYDLFAPGVATSSTAGNIYYQPPTPLRTTPTVNLTNGVLFKMSTGSSFAVTLGAAKYAANLSGPVSIAFVTTGQTAGVPVEISDSGSGSGYIWLTAEY